MDEIKNLAILELNKNKLRLVTFDLRFAEADLESSSISDTKIIDTKAVSKAVKEVVKKLGVKISRIAFLIQEKDLYDRFFVVRSDDANAAQTLKSQASEFVGGSLEELHYVYQKVSPFVYQFVGIRKDLLDDYDTLAKDLGYKLEAILPVSFVFSHFVKSLDPFFFVYRGPDETTLVASEYSGVYFSGTYSNTEEVHSKIGSLIKELSTFNRENPISTVYVAGKDISFGEGFKITKIPMPEEFKEAEHIGFERLFIALNVLRGSYFDIVSSYFNFRSVYHSDLALMPQRSIVKYSVPVLAVLTLSLFGGIVFYFSYSVGPSSVQKPQVEGVAEVKVEETKQPETTKSAEPKEEVKVDKKLLKIRVENGAGLAGIAAKAKDALTSKGYNVTEIGNATSTDYVNVTIKIKESKRGITETLKADLAGLYTVSKIETLSETSAFDILIIVGR